MSGIYRIEGTGDDRRVTWRQTDTSHVTVHIANGPLDHVLNAIAEDANTRNPR